MAIIQVSDLPTDVQSAEMVDAMVAGANARALRVAPCLDTATVNWAGSTEYTIGQKVLLTGGNTLQVTSAGTSAATEPTSPSLGATVSDGTVTWTRVAPPSFDQIAEAKLVLIGAIKRWFEAGVGAFQQQTAGPFSVSTDTRQRTGYNLWPSEIEQLQDICKQESSGSFSVDTAPSGSWHSPICALAFGAAYCSCGADIAGFALYEDVEP